MYIFTHVYIYTCTYIYNFPGKLQMVKNSSRPGFDPWVRKIPWRREWLTPSELFPGVFYGQRSLESYSPWGHKGSAMTEQLTTSYIYTHAHIYIHIYIYSHIYIYIYTHRHTRTSLMCFLLLRNVSLN